MRNNLLGQVLGVFQSVIPDETVDLHLDLLQFPLLFLQHGETSLRRLQKRVEPLAIRT